MLTLWARTETENTWSLGQQEKQTAVPFFNTRFSADIHYVPCAEAVGLQECRRPGVSSLQHTKASDLAGNRSICWLKRNVLLAGLVSTPSGFWIASANISCSLPQLIQICTVSSGLWAGTHMSSVMSSLPPWTERPIFWSASVGIYISGWTTILLPVRQKWLFLLISWCFTQLFSHYIVI